MTTKTKHSIVNGKLFWPALCLIVPSLAHAHVSTDHTTSVLNGLVHPWSGLDHVLAMLAVGLWAGQLGGRATWLVPATFVCLMTAGGALGMTSVALPFDGVLVSVLVLGVLIAAAARPPLAMSAAVVGLFAIFHGHAHGTEMQAGVSGLSYALGFVLATAGLHACGIGIGRLAPRQQSKTPLLRFAGAAIALVGLCLCLM